MTPNAHDAKRAFEAKREAARDKARQQEREATRVQNGLPALLDRFPELSPEPILRHTAQTVIPAIPSAHPAIDAFANSRLSPRISQSNERAAGSEFGVAKNAAYLRGASNPRTSLSPVQSPSSPPIWSPTVTSSSPSGGERTTGTDKMMLSPPQQLINPLCDITVDPIPAVLPQDLYASLPPPERASTPQERASTPPELSLVETLNAQLRESEAHRLQVEMDLLNAKLKFEIESSMAAAELKLLKGEIDDISSGQTTPPNVSPVPVAQSPSRCKSPVKLAAMLRDELAVAYQHEEQLQAELAATRAQAKATSATAGALAKVSEGQAAFLNRELTASKQQSEQLQNQLEQMEQKVAAAVGAAEQGHRQGMQEQSALIAELRQQLGAAETAHQEQLADTAISSESAADNQAALERQLEAMMQASLAELIGELEMKDQSIADLNIERAESAERERQLEAMMNELTLSLEAVTDQREQAAVVGSSKQSAPSSPGQTKQQELEEEIANVQAQIDVAASPSSPERKMMANGSPPSRERVRSPVRFSRSPGMMPSRSPSEGAAWDHELVARLEHDLAEANAAAEEMSVELHACRFKLNQSREEVEMLTCQEPESEGPVVETSEEAADRIAMLQQLKHELAIARKELGDEIEEKEQMCHHLSRSHSEEIASLAQQKDAVQKKLDLARELIGEAQKDLEMLATTVEERDQLRVALRECTEERDTLRLTLKQ